MLFIAVDVYLEQHQKLYQTLNKTQVTDDLAFIHKLAQNVIIAAKDALEGAEKINQSDKKGS